VTSAVNSLWLKVGSRKFALDSSLPFLNTYRTMCLAPDVAFLEVIEQVGALRIAA
jgi:hypothetical protein